MAPSACCRKAGAETRFALGRASTSGSMTACSAQAHTTMGTVRRDGIAGRRTSKTDRIGRLRKKENSINFNTALACGPFFPVTMQFRMYYTGVYSHWRSCQHKSPNFFRSRGRGAGSARSPGLDACRLEDRIGDPTHSATLRRVGFRDWSHAAETPVPLFAGTDCRHPVCGRHRRRPVEIRAAIHFPRRRRRVGRSMAAATSSSHAMRA